ncbi:MAG: DUF427 domain-containing protein [Myxococcota bacterium]
MHDDDLARARAKWRFRGDDRPEFALAPGPGQESVWDYPRPPRIVADPREVRVLYNDVPIADTRNALRVLETASPPVFYLPPSDVDTDRLRRERGSSLCEWKGAAAYWSWVTDDGHALSNVAWSYPKPFPEFEAIRDYISFYPARVTCYVGSERVGPQPGGFYGGWVTSDVVGPFKGEPGTGGW